MRQSGGPSTSSGASVTNLEDRPMPPPIGTVQRDAAEDTIPSERPTYYRVGPITMFSHWPMGAMRVLQFPSVPKYC